MLFDTGTRPRILKEFSDLTVSCLSMGRENPSAFARILLMEEEADEVVEKGLMGPPVYLAVEEEEEEEEDVKCGATRTVHPNFW